MLITSKENKVIKEIMKLKQKKYRDDKFIIEGITIIEEAIKENVNIECIVVSENFENKLAFEKYNVIEVTENIFKELTELETSTGILAVVKKNNMQTKVDINANFILALDSIRDPGNLGTIIRTADAAGLIQVIISKGTCDPYSAKVIRSTMGSIFRVNIIEAENLAIMLDDLKKNGFKICVTTLEKSKSLYETDLNKSIVVIGNEANGVSKEVQDIADENIKIPMLGKAESLNASIAAGVVIYEHVRQQL